ncbi:MAG TPA: branched-chain amino acid ABC transporter permease [Candidatus Korarchaeota archaeon]|nr:branched-chain amino acid ABC transporter permease [Candidatus Korarchaeota archaeon]
MFPPVIKDAVIYANLILMLAIGFTLTYLIAKIPNFAHGTFAGIGIYTTFWVARVKHMNPYISPPIAFILGAIVGASIFLVVIQTLRKYKATPISLTISTIALNIIMVALLNIYADYVRESTEETIFTRGFQFRRLDFRLFDLPGVLIATTILIVFLILSLHLMLTKTKFGIALRATVENSDLATMMGVNVDRVSTFSWFLTGGLASLSGSFLPLWFQGNPGTGNLLMTSVFAASILGGINSIYGAMIGGYMLGLSEILITSLLAKYISGSLAAYRMLIPLTILSVSLLMAPTGIMGIVEKYREKKATIARKEIETTPEIKAEIEKEEKERVFVEREGMKS